MLSVITVNYAMFFLCFRELMGKDVLSKSDPMVVTYIQPFAEKRWVEYHRTEVIYNSHDPDFVKKINISYRFEEQQFLRFDVYDVDSQSNSLADHDFLGSVTCTLGQLVGSAKVQFVYKLALKDHRIYFCHSCKKFLYSNLTFNIVYTY